MRVLRVDTRGKALLIRFEQGLTLYAHNQLYGRWYLNKRGTFPKTGRSLRVALHTETDSALLYSASDIAVLLPEEELDPSVSLTDWARRAGSWADVAGDCATSQRRPV